MRTAVVVPTIRDDSFYTFLDSWGELFEKHDVILIKVEDGDVPKATVLDFAVDRSSHHALDGYESTARPLFESLGPDYSGIISNMSPACRNLGFALIAKHLPEVSVIITLDDDVLPVVDDEEDTISQHLNALTKRVPVTWLNTIQSGGFPRGFPYNLRKDRQVGLSHGVWENVPDWDAPTQLQIEAGEMKHDPVFYEGVVPRGVYFPFCGMNVAFLAELLPIVYYAPVSRLEGCQRFDDIWAGIHIKDACDHGGWAVVTGYSVCEHVRASNVFKNLRQEAVGLEMNETYYLDHGSSKQDFQEAYAVKRGLWSYAIGTWRLANAVRSQQPD